ncbi:DUF4870 domain-containing protein [Chitinophaga polysaccharea]|uniref:DUF4870 domain-containing protein n=1 Tax=Chitinophaga TaxID=79328 RepID=UPI001455C2AF|nr:MULTISPECIES: DUF4870 domain-containing protein [Chitinophaga]NLR60772.1 DUF4870 domain-containing protein [Chitinophaga polysaccharea]NLU94927.1 DUF4870 domain-containing protein [Chitinophaga sp. Ak27]
MKTNQWAMIAYITIIGWIIAFVKSKEERSALVSYHLEQALGLAIASIVWSIAVGIVIAVLPAALSGVLAIAGFLPIIFMIFGIINANNGVQKPIPVIGKMFENKFAFLQA